MYHYSDSESSDSDRGIRYKTESIRNKSETRESEREHSNNSNSGRCTTSPSGDSKLKQGRRLKEVKKTGSKKKKRDDDRKHSHRHSKQKADRQKEISNHDSEKRKTGRSEKQSPIPQKNNDIKVEIKEQPTPVANTNIIGPSVPQLAKDKELELSHSKCEEIIGPVLPPHLSNSTFETSPTSKGEIIGPILPTHDEEAVPIGPILPSNLVQNNQSDNKTSERRIIGPSLPPYLNQSTTSEISCNIKDSLNNLPLTPDIIPSLIQPASSIRENHEEIWTTIDSIGDDSDDNEVYGPLPEGASATRAHLELEERALQMKIDKLAPKGLEVPVREEWMTELPAAKAVTFGMGPRQFRSKAGPDLSDRSSWTDTPQDKANKRRNNKDEIDYKKEVERAAILEKDKEQELIAKKIKRSKQSLVDIHTKKLKTKKNDGPMDRRPFSRDLDLQVNRFDEAQKKAVLKKAQLLDTRFSSGESKFL